MDLQLLSPFRRYRRQWRWLAAGAGLLCLGLVATTGYWWSEFAWRRPPIIRQRAESATWLAHRWVGEPVRATAVEGLGRRLQRNGIAEVYVHVGPLEADGTLAPERHRHSAAFVAALRHVAPKVRVLAWIGQKEKGGGGPLDLDDAATRVHIGGTVRELLARGFDGIHLNIEPIRDGDQRFVQVLAVLRGITAAERRLLSVAGDEIEPFTGANRLVAWLTPRGGLWSASYYQQVAWHVDEIALMAYDTAAPWGWAYAKLIEWETKALARTLPESVRLLVGLPTYEERRWSFHPEAENLVSGLTGVRRGLASSGASGPQEIGVAVYADWTTDDAKWASFREMWSEQETTR